MHIPKTDNAKSPSHIGKIWQKAGNRKIKLAKISKMH
jgi:hypothetical protein